jgi:adenylosuccinate lyase
MNTVMEGLVVDTDRVARNLGQSGGLIFSEAVLLALVRGGMPRQRAYERVQGQAMAAHRGEGEFRRLLGADPEIAGRLTEAELDACFDLRHHLRYVDLIFQRVFREASG